MIQSEFRFTLDTHAAASQVSLGVKKGETGRRLRIHLTEAGYPYHIPDNCYAVFAATKPDGKKIFNDCVIDDCEIIYDMTEQTVAAAGLMVCAINLYGVENDLLISASFSIIVYCPPVDQDDLESTSEYKALAALIAEAEALKEGLEEGGGPGGYYVPVVDQPTENTLQFSWMASGEGLPAVPPAVVELPGGGNDSGQNAPEIVGTTVGEKAMEFSYLLHGADKVESFAFFADPHFLNSINNEAQMREYLDTLKLYHDVTPTSFVIGGGDWYGNSDTYESACFKLGYIDGWMHRLFGDKYYPAVGNHDTNQQGVDETGGAWTGILSMETVRNLWFREHGNTYYAFDGVNTKFYVMDTWKEGTDSAYYWEQIAWLGEKLKTDNAENSALVLHMGYYPLSGGGFGVNTLAANALALGEAFNNATSITLNGVSYDFTGCTGKVRFALSGHIHADYATIVKGIPLIATTHMRDGNTPTFDLCLADYGSNKLYMVRVGTGENREFEIAADMESGVSLILGMNLTGRNFHNNVKFRSIYVGAAQPEGITAAIPWSNASTGDYPYSVPYYPIEIPEGATKVTVTCPNYVKWAVVGWSKSGWNADENKTEDSGWLPEGGGTYELAAESEVLMILFNDNNGSDMSADTYDSSTFSMTFT